MKIIDYPVRHSYLPAVASRQAMQAGEVAGGSSINKILEIVTATLIFILPALALFVLAK